MAFIETNNLELPERVAAGVSYEALLLGLGSIDTLLALVGQAHGATVLMTMDVIPDLVPEEHTFKTFEDCTAFLKTLER